MNGIVSLLGKILTNILTALYEPIGISLLLSFLAMIFYLYAYEPAAAGSAELGGYGVGKFIGELMTFACRLAGFAPAKNIAYAHGAAGYRAAAASGGLLPSLREIVERSSVRLLGVVPFDPLLQTDQEAGRITFDAFASRRARCYEAAFMNIAARITCRRVPLLKNVAYPVMRKKYVRA